MTWYVHRRANGTIQSAHREAQKGYADESVADQDGEILAFFAAAYPAPSYRDKRAVAYRDEMGAERGDFVKTIGDVLDAILEQFAEMGAAGTALTDEMTALLVKRSDIKTRIPKT